MTSTMNNEAEIYISKIMLKITPTDCIILSVYVVFFFRFVKKILVFKIIEQNK